jgi:hypothetical protein
MEKCGWSVEMLVKKTLQNLKTIEGQRDYYNVDLNGYIYTSHVLMTFGDKARVRTK